MIFATLALSVVAIALAVYFVQHPKNTNGTKDKLVEDYIKNNQVLNQQTQERNEKAAKTNVDPNATDADKAVHYTSALKYYMDKNDATGATDYYVNNFLPNNISLRQDYKERLIVYLKNTKYKTEYAKLIKETLAMYRSNIDSATLTGIEKQQIQAKIDEYSQLEKNL